MFLRNCTQHQKHKTLFKRFKEKSLKKEDGWAFWWGIYIIGFLVVFLAILLQKYKFQAIEQEIEDTLTSSSLASLLWDEKNYALTRDATLTDVDHSYEILCQLVGDTFHLTQVGTCEYEGDHPYFRTNVNRCRLDTVIFYNVYTSQDKVDVFTYTGLDDGAFTKDVDDNVPLGTVKTPTNEDVYETSCYLVYRFTIRVCGLDFEVKKGSYVTVRDNYAGGGFSPIPTPLDPVVP